MLCHPGDIITVTPGRAQRLVAAGIGEKVGVSERVEEEPEEVEEELSEDDVEDDDDEDEEVGTAD
jgi:hypothetical protein